MNNVVELFAKKKNTNLAEKIASEMKSSHFYPLKAEKNGNEKESFSKVIEHNMTNQERLRKERELANKNVMKTYNIK